MFAIYVQYLDVLEELHHKRLRKQLPQTCNIETIFVHKEEDVGNTLRAEYAFLTKGAVRVESNLSKTFA